MFVPRRSLPPLNAVRAFEAAARLGSFKEAAAELGVTHGAVSQQIRLLEDWLGPPALFRRSVRRVVLTPAGAALLAEFGPRSIASRPPCSSIGNGAARRRLRCCASMRWRPSACAGCCRA